LAGVVKLHLTVSELIELALLTIVGVYVIADVAIYYMRRTAKRAEIFPPPKPRIPFATDANEVEIAADNESVLVGHESNGDPFYWSNDVRARQTIASGMTGAGKTTLIESILQQDIRRGVRSSLWTGRARKSSSTAFCHTWKRPDECTNLD